MATLVDTSVWVQVFRAPALRGRLEDLLAGDDIVLVRFVQLELLEGARDEPEWALLDGHLDGQDYLEATPRTWRDAARAYFELRRQGVTVRSPIDCVIAQIASDAQVRLVHRDHDFDAIARVRSLHLAGFEV